MIVLQSVRCRNFKALTELEIHFPGRCSFLIEGANEAGKTSLLDAVYFAFAGTGPNGVPARGLVTRGEDEAAVTVEFAGDDAFGVLQRTVPRHGPATVRLKLERRFQSHELDTEAEVQEQLAKTFGLDAAGLARVSFLRELDLSPTVTNTRSTNRPTVVERKELSRTRGDLADVSRLREELAQAQQRIELAEDSARLGELNLRRSELDQRLRLIHIAGLRDRYIASAAEVLSVQARLGGLNESRDGLRHDLELAERQSATITVVDAIQTARDVHAEVDDRLRAQQHDLDTAGQADRDAARATARAEFIEQALAHLEAAETSGLERTDFQRRQDQLKASLAELDRFRQQRATLTDARASIESELAGIRRNIAGDAPDTSLISARRLWTAWIETFGVDIDDLLAARSGSRFSPGGLVSRAVSRIRGSADSVATESDAGPATAQSEERVEIESALRANDFEIPPDIDSAMALLESAGFEAPTPGATPAGDAIPAEESLRVTDQNLVSVIVRATRLDESIKQLEAGLDRTELSELESGIEAALQRSAGSLRAAAAAVGTGDGPPDLSTLRSERDEIQRSLPKLKESASRQPDLERELDRLRAEREGARETVAELTAQLREIWPERFENGASPPPEYLEKLREDSAAALSQQDAPSFNRAITEIASQISSGELALDVVKRKQDQAVERLAEKVEAEGSTLNRGDVEASLNFSLPGLRSVTSVEDQRVKLEIQQIEQSLAEAESSVEAREQRLGELRTHVRLDAERTRVEELERRIGVRLRASEIAGRAQERMRAKAVPKTLQNARTLLPIVTGDRYFDLRFAGPGGVELWDEAAADWAPLATLAFGTRRQVGLALRLAEAITAGGPSSPGGPAFMFVDEAALGSDPEHRARISAVLREGLLRDTFAQVIVLAGRDDFHSADFDRNLLLTAGSSAVPGNGHLKAAAPGVFAELRRGTED